MSLSERDVYICSIEFKASVEPAGVFGQHFAEMCQDIDNFAEKYDLDDTSRTRVADYLLLNSRYHDSSWQGFLGYYHEGHIGTFFGEEIPDDIKKLLHKWLKNGVPENIPCHLEVEDDSLFGNVWRLSCDVGR